MNTVSYLKIRGPFIVSVSMKREVVKISLTETKFYGTLDERE